MRTVLSGNIDFEYQNTEKLQYNIQNNAWGLKCYAARFVDNTMD